MKESNIKVLSYIVSLLIVIHLLLFSIKYFTFVFIERTEFVDRIASMIGMIILSFLFVLSTKRQNVSMSVFPKRFNKFYILGTCIAATVFITTPSNYSGGFQAIVLLIYGSIVTPIFEELIFRGYIWNKLNTIFRYDCYVWALAFGIY